MQPGHGLITKGVGRRQLRAADPRLDPRLSPCLLSHAHPGGQRGQGLQLSLGRVGGGAGRGGSVHLANERPEY